MDCLKDKRNAVIPRIGFSILSIKSVVTVQDAGFDLGASAMVFRSVVIQSGYNDEQKIMKIFGG